MDTKSPITFISACLSNLTYRENEQRTLELRKDLARLGLRFTTADGYYADYSEPAFLVVHQGGTAGDYWPTLVRLGLKYGQESLLHVGSDRFGSLYFIDSNHWVGLGKFRQVSEEFAKRHDAYSRVNGQYYYCGK